MRSAEKLTRLIESDPQVASLVPLPEVGKYLRSTDDDLPTIMDRVFAAYAERPALGSREYDIVPVPNGRMERHYRQSFGTITYGQLRDRVHAISHAWSTHPVHGLEPDEHVCIFGFVGVDFTVLDFAAAHVHVVTVPLQMGAIHMDFGEILDEIRPAAVAACTGDLVAVAKLVADRNFVRSIVVFDCDQRVDGDRASVSEASEILRHGDGNAALIPLADLEAQGNASAWQPRDPHPKGASRVASIVHSSGSTGKPKAALIPESAIRFFWHSIPENAPPVIAVCLAPFSHMLGKGSMLTALRQGGMACFTLAADMSTLFDDIRIARPTFMGLFPRIVELVYQHYQNEVDHEQRASGDSEHAARARVCSRMGAEYLGDRLCFVLSGGSRISPVVRAFFEGCFGVPMLDAYGNTEGGSVAVDNMVQRPPVTDYRLRDVPELGYFVTDKPHPRGEFCFKSAQSILGYHNDPEATARLFDDEGFICTGDIVEELGPDQIRVIDRRNDVIKLSQGEFVAVGALAELFEAGSDLIRQAYIHGDPQRSFLLAVIVPDLAIAARHLSDLTDERALKTLLQEEVLHVAQAQGIRSFEVPRSVLVETEPFSSENGLLSGLRKKIRPALARRYGPQLADMYEAIERERLEGRKSLTAQDCALGVSEKLIRLLELDLNIEGVDPASPSTFYELGGDSLSAVLFSLSIEEIFGVDLPPDRLLSPTGNVQEWTRQIEQAVSGDDQQPTAVSIHGKSNTTIDAEDLSLGRFVDDSLIEAARALPGPSARADRILLTGANGFLGRFVCLESLERAARNGGKVTCLIRARNHEMARERLDEVFAGTDPALQSRYRALAEHHLEVLAGDVGEVHLGLRDEDYRRLSGEVDRVIHVAALVNHRLSYANLFRVNVLGTAEIIRFAVTGKRKSIDYVSTIAIVPLLDTDRGGGEDTPLLGRIDLSDGYAAGYAASKWASEHLLLQAGTLCGVPVNIFRGDMMLPHQHYRGQINIADIFSRLLFSVIRTGMAPFSFHPLLPDGSRAKAHYDGLPVDVVASAIVGAPAPVAAGRVYHMTNYHADDGLSLDTFVDWIAESGYEIARIKDYQAWLRAFHSAVAQLPDDQKDHSALNVIDAFAAPMPADGMPIESTHFRQLVHSTAGGADIPHLSREYIAKCLSDMQMLGLVDPISETQERTA